MKLLVATVSKILIKGTRKRPLRDIAFLLLDYGEQIAQLPASEACADIMQNDDSIRREFASKLSDKAGKLVKEPGIKSI